jgi:hypothetical protein
VVAWWGLDGTSVFFGSLAPIGGAVPANQRWIDTVGRAGSHRVKIYVLLPFQAALILSDFCLINNYFK